MKNTLLLIIEFIICATIGFAVPKLFHSSEPDGNTSGTRHGKEAETPAAPIINEISNPEYDAASGRYVFTVSAKGAGLTYYLANASRAILRNQENNDGRFAVRPVAGGQYYVFVRDSLGNESAYHLVEGCIAKEITNKVTAEEFQRLLNERNLGSIKSAFSGRANNTIAYSFVGKSDDDEGEDPKSYTEIINRLNMGTWSSVSVNSVGYDATGRLSRASIKINY